MRVTLADIAEVAGVNKTTVSKAIRGSDDISADTRRRILDLAEQMGYEALAGRRKERSGLIGVLCPEVNSHYYARLAEALDKQLADAGHSMILILTGFEPERERAALDRFRDMSADAVICITEQPDLDVVIRDAFPGSDTPVIVLGIDYKGVAHDVISVDERLGIRRAIDQLVSFRHKRFAFLGDSFVSGRLAHMRAALKAHDIDLPDEYACLRGERGEACGYEGMRALLALKQPPTAVLAGYDAIALGAYRALSEARVSVPGDISLVGFDNAPFCPYLPVAMTTIDSNVDGMCAIAAAIIAKKLKQRDYKIIQRVAIQPVFMARESIAAARD